jgi:hypothetical protein
VIFPGIRCPFYVPVVGDHATPLRLQNQLGAILAACDYELLQSRCVVRRERGRSASANSGIGRVFVTSFLISSLPSMHLYEPYDRACRTSPRSLLPPSFQLRTNPPPLSLHLRAHWLTRLTQTNHSLCGLFIPQGLEDPPGAASGRYERMTCGKRENVRWAACIRCGRVDRWKCIV